MVDRPVAVVGDSSWNPIDQLSSFDNLIGVHRVCDVGTGALDIPAPTKLDRRLLVPGNTIQIHIGGRVAQSGMLRQVGEASDAEFVSKPSWVDENDYLRQERAWPNPTPVPGQENSQAGQGAAEYDRRSGYASTVILGYVLANIGPQAIYWRRAPGVVMGADMLAGAYLNTPVALRGENLLDAMRNIALPAGCVFDFTTLDRNHFFNVRQVQDLSDTIVFSHRTHSLGPGEWSLKAPTATRIMAWGPGEGAARMMFPVTSEESLRQERAWGRAFTDLHDSTTTIKLGDTQDTDLPATIAAVTAEAQRKLSESGETVEAQFEVLDTDWKFGIDYQLGDLVGVHPDGLPEPLVYPVREVTEKWSVSGGHSVTPLVGDYQATSSTGAAFTTRQILRTVDSLKVRR